MLSEKELEKKIHGLEVDAEAKTNAKEDKVRQIKLMEVCDNVE